MALPMVARVEVKASNESNNAFGSVGPVIFTVVVVAVVVVVADCAAAAAAAAAAAVVEGVADVAVPVDGRVDRIGAVAMFGLLVCRCFVVLCGHFSRQRSFFRGLGMSCLGLAVERARDGHLPRWARGVCLALTIFPS